MRLFWNIGTYIKNKRKSHSLGCSLGRWIGQHTIATWVHQRRSHCTPVPLLQQVAVWDWSQVNHLFLLYNLFSKSTSLKISVPFSLDDASLMRKQWEPRYYVERINSHLQTRIHSRAWCLWLEWSMETLTIEALTPCLPYTRQNYTADFRNNSITYLPFLGIRSLWMLPNHFVRNIFTTFLILPLPNWSIVNII